MLKSIGALACLGCVCRPAEQTGRWGLNAASPYPILYGAGAERLLCSCFRCGKAPLRSRIRWFPPGGSALRAARKTCGCAGEPVLQPKRAGRAFQHFRKAAGQRLVAAEVHQSFRIMKLMDGGMAFVVIVHTELCCVKIKLRAGSCADKARAAPPGVVFYQEMSDGMK